MMRRVKKTTNEQFDLLKAEMALHPAAARGYGVGAQRAVVDAEWKDIVDKLNALGPPERTMTEWKKVWSDVRLRIKKQSLKRAKKNRTHKKEKPHPEEDQLMEALNSSISIYGRNIKTEYSSQNQDVAAENNNTFEPEDQQEIIDNNTIYKILDVNTQCDNDMEQRIITVQNQMEAQEKLMTQLLRITTNMSELMERHLKAVEKKTWLMERQLKLNENHNIFMRRQATRRKFKYSKRY